MVVSNTESGETRGGKRIKTGGRLKEKSKEHGAACSGRKRRSFGKGGGWDERGGRGRRERSAGS